MNFNRTCEILTTKSAHVHFKTYNMKTIKSFFCDLKTVVELIFWVSLFVVFMHFFSKGQQENDKNEPIYTTIK